MAIQQVETTRWRGSWGQGLSEPRAEPQGQGYQEARDLGEKSHWEARGLIRRGEP